MAYQHIIDGPMLSQRAGILRLEILVAPRASRTAILGIHDQRLKIALSAPPVDGKANISLLDFLAEVLEIPKRDLKISKGHTGKRKTVEIVGMSLEAAKEKLMATHQ